MMPVPCLIGFLAVMCALGVDAQHQFTFALTTSVGQLVATFFSI